MGIEIVILAAGKGARMRSSKPKVLHELGGKAMLLHLIDSVKQLNPSKIHVVVGHAAAQVESHVNASYVGANCAGAEGINWVYQRQQNGTGDAVAQAIAHVDPTATVLILAGDVPLIGAKTLAQLTTSAVGGDGADSGDEASIKLLTVRLSDPSGFGRIIRRDGDKISAIVEDKDANAAELAINEVNTGVMALPADLLADLLTRLADSGMANNNAQGEFYLTDIIALADAANIPIKGVFAPSADEVAGVNSRADLARLERVYQRQQAQQWMAQGVSFADPERVDFRSDFESGETPVLGEDVFIDVNVILSGKTRIAAKVHIGANTLINNTFIGADTAIAAHCVIEGAVIGAGCRIGPFARLRPGTELAAGATIGNFVEIKKSLIGAASKVNHLSYVGDSTVGAGVNIGAGVITCNYDGANKHQTLIGDDVFIGSNCALIAPLTIGAGATIGAGSTIAKNVAAAKLSLSRNPQRSVDGWQRPKKTPNSE